MKKKLPIVLVKQRLQELWKNGFDLETRTEFEEYIIHSSGYSEVEFFFLCVDR